MYDDIVAKLSKLAEGNETYAEFNKRIVNTGMPVIGVRAGFAALGEGVSA